MPTRKVPRKFKLHFGSGVVAEEATIAAEHHQPTVQLLEFQDGEAAGTVILRFCSYSTRGQFMRDPMMISEAEISGLREAVHSSPRIHELLKRLVD